MAAALKVIAPTSAAAALIFYVGFTYEREQAEVFGVTPEFFDRSRVDYVLSGVPIALLFVTVGLAVVIVAALLGAFGRSVIDEHPVVGAVLAVVVLLASVALVAHSLIADQPLEVPRRLVVVVALLAVLLVVIAAADRSASGRESREPHAAVLVLAALSVMAAFVLAVLRLLQPDPANYVKSLREVVGSSVPRGDHAHVWLVAVGLALVGFLMVLLVTPETEDATEIPDTDDPDGSDDPRTSEAAARRIVDPLSGAVQLLGRTVLIGLLVSLLLGAVAVYAVRRVEIAGTQAGAARLGLAGEEFIESESELPQVVLLASDSLRIDIPGFGSERAPETDGEPWQYRGLRLLHRSGSRYLLVAFVPSSSSGSVLPIVFTVAESDGLRVLVDRGGAARPDRHAWLGATGVGLDQDGAVLYPLRSLPRLNVPGGNQFGRRAGDNASLVDGLRAIFFTPDLTIEGPCRGGLLAADWRGLRLVYAHPYGAVRSPDGMTIEDLDEWWLVGWRYDGDTDPLLTTADGVSIGDTRPDDDSTITYEPDELNRVAAMYAGEQCTMDTSSAADPTAGQTADVACAIPGWDRDQRSLFAGGQGCAALRFSRRGEDVRVPYEEWDATERRAFLEEVIAGDGLLDCRASGVGDVWVALESALRAGPNGRSTRAHVRVGNGETLGEVWSGAADGSADGAVLLYDEPSLTSPYSELDPREGSAPVPDEVLLSVRPDQMPVEETLEQLAPAATAPELADADVPSTVRLLTCGDYEIALAVADTTS